jgi:hypothetical protein
MARVFMATPNIVMALRNFSLLAIILIVFCQEMAAQETEFLPEVDIYLKLNFNVRFRGQIQNAREGSDPTQLTIGPDLQFYLKPLLRLKEVVAFDLDDAKSRPFVLSAGYRLLAAPGSPSTNRMVLTATSHFPVKRWLLISDRNRSDLDWSAGKFKWRYRNRLDIEKSLSIRSYHPSPYSSFEVYYEEQYHKWSTTEIDVGCLFPFGKHFELDPYYKHQNNTGKSPNQQLNGLGVIFDAYF